VKRLGLVDILTPDECRIWFRLAGGDLDLKPCGTDSIGTEPTWLGFEVDQGGWDMLAEYPLAWRTGWERMEWAMARGIAPRQPFLMAIEKPEYSKTWTDCGYEHDTHYSAEVLAVTPFPPNVAARRWERWLWEDALYRAETTQRHAQEAAHAHQLREQALRDPSSLYLDAEPYYGPGDALDWIPSAIRVWLRSGYGPTLAYGEDSRGSLDKAMEDLLSRAAKVLPNVRPEYIRALPFNRPRIERPQAA
jgi:hypothetical protein